ncbi:PAS domain S-box protein [Pseudotabrizicola sp.]|uniref:PAS domain S-box protein n=1 Tax=Pseudotabrizicola sp. TaxID=2939647 RepID=UPI00271B9913|nr:PAS domain S-box protein [Pseudotabrizicola sp.]MDO8883805.1 PAS domain S-box protein [Pseudotabrizicola sp.]
MGALNGSGRSFSVTAALLLAIPDVLADLAEAGALAADRAALDGAVQSGLNRISDALGSPLRLGVGDKLWLAGAGADVAPNQISHAGARLEGVPKPLPDPSEHALRAVLRAVVAQHRAALLAAEQLRTCTNAKGKIARRDLLLRRLFDLAPVGVVLINHATGTVIEANTAFMAFGNWSREALTGVPITAFLPPDQEAILRRAVAELDEGGRFGPYDQQFVRPDGSGFPAILRGMMLKAGDGQKIVWLMVEDVSELRAHLAEIQAVRDEALRARAELQTAVQALPHGFMLFDAEDRIVMSNSQMLVMYPDLAPVMIPGTKYEDMVRFGLAAGLWPVPDVGPEAYVQDVMARRRKPLLDLQVETQDGRVVRVVDHQTPTGGRVGLRIDVTAETDSQRRLTHVIEGSQAGTWECDFVTWENRVNERWAQMLGWTCAELAPITVLTWQSLLHPDDLEPALAALMQVARRDAEVFDMVFRLRHRAGHWVWVQSRGTVSLRDAEGTPIRMSGVHVDVSALKEAEQRLEQIINGAEAGTWHHDMTNGICHVNAIWMQMLGYTLDELGPITDAVWRGLLHPDDWIMLNSNMQDRFDAGVHQFQDELRLRHADGHWVWVASRGQVAAWDATGHATATTGVHIDISARKRLEHDLEAERDFMATLMETSGNGILAVDEDARVVFFNREVQRILELPSEELLHRICDPVALRLKDLDGQILPFSGLPCRLALTSGRTIRDMRLRIDMADGREKVISVNAAVLPDPGMTARVVCTITDVTAAARSEDDLRGAIHRAEAASGAKSQFLANMSHELRTPLNGVLGMAELLAEGALDPRHRIMLDAIRESGEHLLSVVNDILDLAKIESGKLALDLAPMRPRELVSRIEAMHGLAARRKEIGLNVTLGPGSDTLRIADSKRLLQVLHNLIGNAVKFTETGAVTVTIEEDIARSGHLIIAVADTGIGMSEDQTAVVFDDFIQADGSITRRFGGTGLGLPIVRRLVALMEGEIDLTSSFGKGTTVTVTLPMPPVALPCSPAQNPVCSPTPAVPDFTGMRALFAEDNPTNRLIMRAMLVRLGIEVTLVCDGDEALAHYAPGRFDLVLLDISMPGKDGLTALAEMRDRAGNAGLPPVLAVTAHAMEQNLKDYRAAGFAEVVTKPVTLEALANAIQRTRHEFPSLLGSVAHPR